VAASNVVSAAGSFSVSNDQINPNTYHFIEDPDFYQADQVVTEFHYDFGDGTGTDEHGPIYTYTSPGKFFPSLKVVWQTADGRQYTTVTTTEIDVNPINTPFQTPTPVDTTDINLNPDTGIGFSPILTPVPSNPVVTTTPFLILNGLTPLPTPTGFVSDTFFQSQPGMYTNSVPQYKVGDTYWGEIPGSPGVFGWITVTKANSIIM